MACSLLYRRCGNDFRVALALYFDCELVNCALPQRHLVLKEKLKSDPSQNGEMICCNWVFICAGSISIRSEFCVCVCVYMCVCM